MTPRAILFDWRGILVHDPPDAYWVQRAFTRAGRSANDVDVDAVSAARAAAALPAVAEGERTADCSVELHRAWSMSWFAAAGLDEQLAGALYELDFDAENHPFYPDVAETLAALRVLCCRIAVVSDIHVDLRPEFEAAGIASAIDTFVLSYEHGVQKPGRAIFEIALRALDVAPAEALMVGDRASHDGGAVAAGIPTLLLPPLPEFGPRGLDRVVKLATPR